MRKFLKNGLGLATCISAIFGALAPAQNTFAANAWKVLDRVPAAVEAGDPWIRPKFYHAFQLDRAALTALLKQAPLEGTARANHPLRVEIPMPDGTLSQFDIVESPIMEPALQAKYPTIRTYLGQGVQNPGQNVRFDLSPVGYHASIIGPDLAVYVDPFTKGNLDYYTSYDVKNDRVDAERSWWCLTPEGGPVFAPRDVQPGRSGAVRRQFRLACSATGSSRRSGARRPATLPT